MPLDKDVVEGDGIDTTSPDLQDSPKSYLRSNLLRPSKHDENAEGRVATSSSEHLLNSSTDFQHSNVSVTPVFGGANSTLRHAEVAVDPVAIERWPDWDISAAYDGYRVYSHGAGNSIWDIAVLSFYTDAKCAPSSKIALDPTTATLISSGSYNDSYFSPTSAFDESSSSIWGGRRNGEYFWLGYESGPSVVVKCIKIHQGNSGGDWMQDGFTIQGKQDSGGWINLYDVQGAATASGISLLPVSTSIDYVVVSPEDAPCKDDAKVADAIDCVADFAREGICNWYHWTEMYITCKLSNAKIDDYLLPIVERSQCTWDRWTEGVYDPLYDKYLKDCSGGNGNAGGVNIVNSGSLNACELLRVELILGCTSLLAATFFGAIAYAGCMAVSATAWHICFENMDRRLANGGQIEISQQICGDVCMDLLHNVDAPEAKEYQLDGGITEHEAKIAFDEGMVFGHDLVAKLG